VRDYLGHRINQKHYSFSRVDLVQFTFVFLTSFCSYFSYCCSLGLLCSQVHLVLNGRAWRGVHLNRMRNSDLYCRRISLRDLLLRNHLQYLICLFGISNRYLLWIYLYLLSWILKLNHKLLTHQIVLPDHLLRTHHQFVIYQFGISIH